MITSCKQALAIGGFGPEFIYKYNSDSLPKLYDIIGSDYDAIFEKFIVLSRIFLSDVKKRNTQDNATETDTKLIETVNIKLERTSTHRMSLRGQTNESVATTVITMKKKRLER